LCGGSDPGASNPPRKLLTFFYQPIKKNVFLTSDEGVATISSFLKFIGLFCRISSLLEGSLAKETYNFKEPTHGDRPIPGSEHDSLSGSGSEISMELC